MTEIRDVTVGDEAFLWQMLGYASGAGDSERTVAEVRADPAVSRYLDGWGRTGDAGVVAVDGDRPVGAAWFRLFTDESPAYGFVDEDTAELAIACVPDGRGAGAGRAMLLVLLDRANAAGFERLSLSVRQSNAIAKDLYLDCGFRPVDRPAEGDSETLVAETDRLRRAPSPVVSPAATSELADCALGESSWGDTVVSRGAVHRLAELPGFVAELPERPGEPAGLATFRIDGDEAELVSIESHAGDRGVGTALLRAVRQAATAAGCRRVWLVTTNDNVDALRFYQRRGWQLVALHPFAVDKGRSLKPSIPWIGDHGIAIRHELELEWRLDPQGGRG